MIGKNRREKQSLYLINEHFEPVFNTAAAMQIVFQQPVRNGINWQRPINSTT
ncbi:hypothetical protein SAMN05421755_10085 [Nitrosomonas sp. Nm33]|nr:hypothetical protein SAMN05421755_10085 [Nitrosomonas sp. Nm33]